VSRQPGRIELGHQDFLPDAANGDAAERFGDRRHGADDVQFARLISGSANALSFAARPQDQRFGPRCHLRIGIS
jgi:hypothetical protein